MRDATTDNDLPAEDVSAPPGDGSGRRIPSLRDLLAHVREDRKVNGGLLRPGFQAMIVYRFGVWREGISPRLLRMPFSFLYRAMYVFVRNIYGIELPSTARIGRRLRVAHQHGILVHPEAVIGDDCMIRQGVSIGISRVSKTKGERVAPVLGDRVEVGAGAMIAGAVTIGDDVAIGPNTVVITNVPANSIVTSPMPRIIPRPAGVKGSERLN
jgi:serine O-acetyltransferase